MTLPATIQSSVFLLNPTLRYNGAWDNLFPSIPSPNRENLNQGFGKLKKVDQSLRNFVQESPIGFPLVLFIPALVTYGKFLTSLGFYWDDRLPLVFSHPADKSTIWQFIPYDRLFHFWTDDLQFPICSDSAVGRPIPGPRSRVVCGVFNLLPLAPKPSTFTRPQPAASGWSIRYIPRVQP